MARSERSMRLLVLSALAASCGAVACEGILGLGKFKDCTEPGAICTADAEPIDAADTGLPDAADTGLPDTADAELPLPEGAVGSSWASWKMPNSLAYGEAGSLAATYGSFTPIVVGDASAVLENRSRLVWLDRVLTGGTFKQARDACSQQGPGWRLPTRIELASLLDYGSDAGYGPSSGFAALVGTGTYWTSSIAVNKGEDNSLFWVVDFTNGTVVKATRTTDASRVVCIRGS